MDLYGLSQPPFGAKRGPSGYILLNAHRRVFEMLVEHALRGSGPMLLTGEEGIGKTEMLNAVAGVAEAADVSAARLFRSGPGLVSEAEFDAAVATLGAPASASPPGRRILIIDDFDLLPQTCLPSLRQMMEAGEPPMLLAASAGHSRPDIAPLMRLMRNTLRLIPVSQAESRQFIERSLWMAGSTTRRLLDPDAVRILIARGNGNPGTLCRLMEATLTAGFARGDALITPRTVQAAVGPAPAPAPVHYTRQRPTPDAAIGRRALQIVSVGVFLLGAALFTYRAIHEEPPKASPAAAGRDAAARPREAIPPDLMAALIRRGDMALSEGDVGAARLYFQRAADGGDATAALKLGKTYDPAFTGGGDADPKEAAAWYRRALALGNTAAGGLLQQLPPR